ncbi:MAG: DUF2062 domain-containing protein [Desulfuromonadaceae bacterium]|nr:DUF2062 domain-containing protein [Geobacteraceae bacterium]
MWRQWWISRQSKLFLLRFLRLRAQPDEIAKGFAVGIFVGMTPLIGLHTAIAVFVAMVLGQNKIAAAMAVWISNPVTAPFLYVAQYKTGRFILDTPYISFPDQFNLESLSHFSSTLILPLCLGSFIYALLAAAVAYAIVLRIIPLLKSWRIARWPRPFKRRKV